MTELVEVLLAMAFAIAMLAALEDIRNALLRILEELKKR